MRKCIHVTVMIFQFCNLKHGFLKMNMNNFVLSDLSMIREVYLFNSGRANLFVPKLLSADATFLFHLAKSRCFIPLVNLSSSMIVASCGNPIKINIPLIARASSFKHWFTASLTWTSSLESCLWSSRRCDFRYIQYEQMWSVTCPGYRLSLHHTGTSLEEDV